MKETFNKVHEKVKEIEYEDIISDTSDTLDTDLESELLGM